MFQSADMSLEENLGQVLGFQRVHGRKLNLDKSLKPVSDEDSKL